MSINKLDDVAPIKTITDVVEIARLVNETAGPRYLYRGQGNSSWPVKPGLLRRGNERLADNEKAAIRDLMSVQPSEFSGDQTMFDRLVRMQHFGLPTRLLDVTSNPLVALYFACADPSVADKDGALNVFEVPDHRVKYFDSDAVSCVANLSNMSATEKEILLNMSHEDRLQFNKEDVVDRLLQFIRAEKPYFRSEIDPVDVFRTCYVVPKQNNRRIIAQSGSFLIFGLDTKKGPSYKRDVISFSVSVDKDAKGELLKELDRLSVNASSLFPEIESAAAYVKARYC